MKRTLLASGLGLVAGMAALLVSPACAGKEKVREEEKAGVRTEYLRPCQCGTPEHDVLGCTAACRAGSAACGNPLCTCEGAGGGGF